MGVACVRIVRDDVAEEGDPVPVDARLHPRLRAQHREHDGEPGGREPPPADRQAIGDVGGHADDHRQHAEAGQVLEAVGHQRELHVAVVDEPEHRRQRHGEEQRARQRPPPEPPPPEPQQGGKGRRPQDVRPGGGVRGADLPERVDHGQIRRPQQLADVEPQRASRDQHALDERVAERERLPRGIERQVRRGDDKRYREERRQPRQVGPRDAARLPPVPDEQRRRQRDHDGLRQQAGREEPERQQVAPGPRRLREPDPGQRGGQVEQGREHVLALDDPGDRLDVQRMDREDRRDDPGAGRRQTPQEAPYQQDVDQVEQHVDRVIAERRQPPQLVLQPEARVDDGPVVPLPLDVGGREPDVPQPGPLVHDRRLDEDHVVPDESGPQRRQVGDDDEGAEQHGSPQRQAGRTGDAGPFRRRRAGAGPRAACGRRDAPGRQPLAPCQPRPSLRHALARRRRRSVLSRQRNAPACVITPAYRPPARRAQRPALR